MLDFFDLLIFFFIFSFIGFLIFIFDIKITAGDILYLIPLLFMAAGLSLFFVAERKEKVIVEPIEQVIESPHKDIQTLNRENEELKQENKILHEKIKHLDSKSSNCVTICERY